MALALAVVGVSEVLACRPKVTDPIRWLAEPDLNEQVLDVYLGEVVGVSDPRRLKDLRQCRPLGASPVGENDPPTLDCIETFSNEYRVEVYATELLRGQPSQPAVIEIGGCLSIAPRVGVQVLVFTMRDGTSVLLAQEQQDPAYPRLYDDVALTRVRALLDPRSASEAH